MSVDIRERCLSLKSKINMTHVLAYYGLELKKGRMACPVHGGNNPEAFRLTRDHLGYQCHTNGCKGDIIDFVSKVDGCSKMEALAFLERNAGISHDDDAVKPKKKKEKVEKAEYDFTRHDASWVYSNIDGSDAYEIRRYNSINIPGRKKCKPFTLGRAGLADDDRCLYNLCEIAADINEPIILVEGEKAAEAVYKSGMLGTTNPMGSGQWDPKYGYSETLRDRDVVIIPDADDEGEKWLKAVMADIRGVVGTLQVGSMPEEFVKAHPNIKGHDAADILEQSGKEALVEFIEGVKLSAPVWTRGVEPGIIVTPAEAYGQAEVMIKSGDFEMIDMSEWITGMQCTICRSDLVVILANTGVGKTRILHNIPFHFPKRNFLMCDLELSQQMLGIRYSSMESGLSVQQIIRNIKDGVPNVIPNVPNVYLDNKGGINLQHVIDRTHMIEDIIQEEIHGVAIDYVGLMEKTGASRYGDVSAHAEGFKAWVKDTNRIGFLTSQVARSGGGEDDYYKPPSFFGSKDSGSIENSAQEFLRVWKTDPDDRTALAIDCPKWSHGEPASRAFQLVAKNLKIETPEYYERKQKARMEEEEKIQNEMF